MAEEAHWLLMNELCVRVFGKQVCGCKWILARRRFRRPREEPFFASLGASSGAARTAALQFGARRRRATKSKRRGKPFDTQAGRASRRILSTAVEYIVCFISLHSTSAAARN